ncbi:MAG: pseudaminic acid biosynthesis-associated methylase, partial [Candidatus Margulisiibacteriota bacterium]
VLELGGNIGMNIKAINCLLPNAKTSAVEINARAYEQLKEVCTGQAYLTSILDMQSNVQQSFDFVFTQTVLIHINPNDLQSVYEMMYKYSRRYICVTEYYNPTPVEIVYRGETGKLFKRNFAGEILDKYPDLELVDYGFKYIRDPNFIQDDLTWFLLQKR